MRINWNRLLTCQPSSLGKLFIPSSLPFSNNPDLLQDEIIARSEVSILITLYLVVASEQVYELLVNIPPFLGTVRIGIGVMVKYGYMLVLELDLGLKKPPDSLG